MNVIDAGYEDQEIFEPKPAEHMADLAAQVETLKNSNANLERKLGECEAVAQDRADELMRLEGLLRDAKSEEADARSELTKLQYKLQDSRNAFALLEKQNAATLTRTDTLRQQCHDFEIRAERAEAKLELMQEANADAKPVQMATVPAHMVRGSFDDGGFVAYPNALRTQDAYYQR